MNEIIYKILIVEDQILLRDSLKKLIDEQEDFQVVAEADDAALALPLTIKHNPDLVLMDICAGENSSGIRAARELRQAYPKLKIALMTGVPEIHFEDEARAAGANGFFYKNISGETMISVLKQILNLEGFSVYQSPDTSNILTRSGLTDKELLVLQLICQSKGRKEIADELHLSESTVKAHISQILKKTGYSSIAQLAIYAVSNELLLPGYYA